MKRITATVLSFIMLLSLSACGNSASENAQAEVQPSPSAESTASPSAVPSDEPVYDKIIEISTAEELVAMSREYGEDIEAHKNYLYLLTNDIDMSGVEDFVPIGQMAPYEPDPVEGFPDISYTAPGRKSNGFISTFDGQGYTVKNLTINYKGNAEGKKGYGCMGFFKAVTEGGVVKNLNIENITVNGIGANPWHSANSGGLAGFFAGYAENCHVSGTVSTITCGGGFVSDLCDGARIYNCTADVDISGCWYVAGFAGYTRGNDIYLKDCASFGSMAAYIPYTNHDNIYNVGGFGGMLSGGTYENCHAQTEIIILDPADSVGGMFAFADEKYTKFINCTYHPAYTGNWDLLFSINHVTCRGDYGEFAFTPDESRKPYDFNSSSSAADKDLIAQSKDKNYALYYGKSQGGTQTEILQREVLFYNKLTDEYKSLGFTDVGSSIDSVNEEWGFFQNGDIYHFNFDRFDIYEKGLESLTPKFKLTDRLTLGEVNGENITARYLHAIRRDPNDGTFIAIFSEVPHSLGVNIYTDKSETVMKTNYMIGFITKDGMLTDQLDTSCPVLCRNNGYYRYFTNVNMYVSGNQLNMEVTDRISREIFTKGFWVFDTEQFIVQQAYMGKENIIDNFHSPAAVSGDGRYSLYKVFSDYYQQSVVLLNNSTNETINLGECDYTGFLPDGTIYLQTSKDYKIVNIHGAALFNLSDNFSLIKENKQTIHINNVFRRDDGSFAVVWFESVNERNTADDANFKAQYAVHPFLRADTYKVSLADAEGNLISTVNTSKYAETTKSIDITTPIETVDSNTVMFYSAVNDIRHFEVIVNFATGEHKYIDYR